MSCPPKQQAFTRNRYDDFHQADDMRITSYASRYYLNPPAARCPTTFPANPTIRLQQSGDSWLQGKWRTDVESDLRGVDRLGSRIRCDQVLYNPATNSMNQVPLANAPDEVVPLTFNRLNDPPCTLRCTGWNRWDPLFHNPQETFETPFDFYIPSRTLDKERYNTHSSDSCWFVGGKEQRPTPIKVPDYAG
jgi:hypothetical protein